MKKTILFTVLAGASVGLVGCGSGEISSNTPNIGDKAIIKDYGASEHESKKVDYVNKSNLDFSLYEYEDEFTGLEVSVSRDEFYSDDTEGLVIGSEEEDAENSDELATPYESISISFPLFNKDDSIFKEQLKIAINSVDGTDIDYEKVLEKISEITSDKYLKTIKSEDLVYDDYFIEKEIISKSKFDISVCVSDVGKYNSTVMVQITTDNRSNYAKESGLKFNRAGYKNQETGLAIVHHAHSSESSIDFKIPRNRIDDTQMREQLEIAAEVIGAANEDIEAIYEILKNNKSNNKSKEVSETIEGDRYTIGVYNDPEYMEDTFSIGIYYV